MIYVYTRRNKLKIVAAFLAKCNNMNTCVKMRVAVEIGNGQYQSGTASRLQDT
jgi:hypothetical protein